MMKDALFRLVFFENYLPNCLVRDVAYFSGKKMFAWLGRGERGRAFRYGADLLEMHVWSTTYLNKHIAVRGLVGN